MVSSRATFQIPISWLEIGQALPFPVYTSGNHGHERWLNAGELIQVIDIETLYASGIQHVIVDNQARTAYARYAVERLHQLQKSFDLETVKLAKMIVTAGTAVAENFESRPDAAEAFHLTQRWLSIVSPLLADLKLGSEIVAVFSNECEHTHGVRTAIWGGILSTRLGFAESSRQDAIEACLFHDLGQTLMPIHPNDAQHHEPEHPRLTLELLKSHGDMRPAVYHGIRAHHERLDGTGYPFGLAGDDIFLSARIVGLVDSVDEVWSNQRTQPSWFSAVHSATNAAPNGFESVMVEHMLSMCKMNKERWQSWV